MAGVSCDSRSGCLRSIQHQHGCRREHARRGPRRLPTPGVRLAVAAERRDVRPWQRHGAKPTLSAAYVHEHLRACNNCSTVIPDAGYPGYGPHRCPARVGTKVSVPLRLPSLLSRRSNPGVSEAERTNRDIGLTLTYYLTGWPVAASTHLPDLPSQTAFCPVSELKARSGSEGSSLKPGGDHAPWSSLQMTESSVGRMPLRNARPGVSGSGA